MSRGEKSVPATQQHCLFYTAIAVCLIVLTIGTTCLFFAQAEPESTEAFIARRFPKLYSRVEHVEPEDRDVFQFHGFKTSFLPSDDVVRTYAVNGSDRRRWRESEQSESRARLKRSHRTYDANDNEQFKKQFYQKPEENEMLEDAEEYNVKEEIEGNDSNEFDPEGESVSKSQMVDRVIHTETKVDRGPLDDIMEPGRGQPELEEGEMGSSALLYNQAKSQTVLHAFWKAQGNRELIRQTQANIMKKYIDSNADPCEDFYQYACGNWMTHNPIPADKAGYDTFEMLREYIDTVLRDLLETDKDIPTEFPGAGLDMNEEALQGVLTLHNKLSTNIEFDKNSNRQEDSRYKDKFTVENTNNSEILNRIRRYLDHKKLQDEKKRNLKNKEQSDKHKEVTMVKTEFLKWVKNFSFRTKLWHAHAGCSKSKREVRDAIFPSIGYNNIKRNKKTIEPTPKTDAIAKARFYYTSCMNYDTLHRRGHQPLLDLLNIFGGWPILNSQWDHGNFNWLEMMAKLRLYNNDILISEWVGPDIKNSDKNIIQFDQTSLGLPSRDYFLQEANKEYLDAYKSYMIKIALLLGGDPAYVKESADDVIKFEILLANITSTPEERRNVSELYQRMSIRKLELMIPQIKWRRYLDIVMNRTVSPDETVVMFALNYAKNLVPLISTTPPKTLANYLLWRFVRHRVNNLDDRFQSAKQQFYYVLFGREQAPNRWESCVTQVNSNMGMALGSLFVRKYFDETSKNDTMTMTEAIRRAFRELLNQTDWIDHETKNLAAAKVDSMTLKIGYPDFILDKADLDERYNDVKIHPDKYFENVLNILRHTTKMEQSSLNQQVDKTLWVSAPAVVNAYYSRNKNQIMFPAGILQPPFYHRHFPKSLNFGGIGVVIGHEITHGFDDKGRLFDREGNLHRWWSDRAVDSFHRRAQCLIDQYGQFLIPPVDVKLDGATTQGENIADNGGVKQAFRAYQHWLQQHGAAGETLPGLPHTHTQLFFLNFAQLWCGAMRPEAMRNKLKTAVHSPGRFRVIGSLSNSEDFAREFQCPNGSNMNPISKCTVW